MNSCLQCLFSVVPLMEYFDSGRYRQDLNVSGPGSNHKGSRTKGQLAKSFAELMHKMKNGDNGDIEYPSDVKNIVSLIAPRFSGYACCLLLFCCFVVCCFVLFCLFCFVCLFVCFFSSLSESSALVYAD